MVSGYFTKLSRFTPDDEFCECLYSIQVCQVHELLIVNRASESWTPLCLPKFNDSGFLHAYVCFVAADVCLLLISTKQDSFYQLSNCKREIVEVIVHEFQNLIERRD